MLYFLMDARLSLPRLVVSAVTVVLAALAGEGGEAAALENTVFKQYATYIVQQVHKDKRAFSRASTCLSWFYKGSKTPPPPAAQGIGWRRPVQFAPATDCPRQYPGGMESAREDFSRTQTLLSVSLTVYEFALVADHNDDHAYNATELRDLLASLSLPVDTADSTTLKTLTDRFDAWYRARNLDEVMKGMSILYERGYRVTSGDRADLDRVMK